MSVHPAQLVVLAKAPVPGLVKTRLTPAYSPEEAAALAAASLHDTLAAARASSVRRVVLVLEGDPAGWGGAGVDVRSQVPGTLDRRIGHALQQTWRELAVPVLLVGMDTPQVTASDLDLSVEALLRSDTDAVLGPSTDGGFWALGLREPRPGLVEGVPMSRAETGALQHERLVAAGLRVRLLPTVRDVDDADDADAVAAAAPCTRFASALRGLRRRQEGAA